MLNGLNLEVKTGEFLSIVGASGSGKSTLLAPARHARRAGLRARSSLDGKRIDNLPAGDRDLLRNRTFGYIFQFYHLLPELTTLDNVLMPAYIGHSTLGLVEDALEVAAARRGTAATRSGWRTASSTGRGNSPAARCSGPRSPGRCS